MTRTDERIDNFGNCPNHLANPCDVTIISNQLINNLLKFEIYMCGATIKCVSLLVLIFEQGAVPANNSLCVTIVGVDRIFNCGHVEKGPLVGMESKHLKMLLN